VASCLIGLFDVKHYFHLQLTPHISRHHQYWRLFSHHLACSSFSDLFITELIIFHVGVHIERLYGSVKFTSFALVSVLLSAICEFIALLLLNGLGLNYVPPGPISFLYSILYQHSRLVPSIYHFRVFGVSFNNKAFNYVLPAHLAISQAPGSLFAAAIGIIVGQIYHSDLFNLKTYRVPPWLVRFGLTVLLPLIGSTRPPRRTNRALPEVRVSPAAAILAQDELVTTTRIPIPPAMRQDETEAPTTTTSVMRDWVNELTGSGNRSQVGLRIPTEGEISQVSAMFPNVGRDTVIGALQRSPTAESAIETLLSTQS